MEKELDAEADITLLEEGSDKEKVSRIRTERRQPGIVEGRRPRQNEATERLSALSTPVQVLEAKGKEVSLDVPVEAVA